MGNAMGHLPGGWSTGADSSPHECITCKNPSLLFANTLRGRKYINNIIYGPYAGLKDT